MSTIIAFKHWLDSLSDPRIARTGAALYLVYAGCW